MEETKKKKEKTSVKKVLGAFLALVMVAVISVVGTLAYLSKTTGETLENTFKGSSDIDVTLTEDEWTKVGEQKANQYTPNLTIEKNPTINNTSTGTNGDYSEWVAMRVDYEVENNDGTLAAVAFSEFFPGIVSSFNATDGNAISDFANRKWIKITPGSSAAKFDIFVYKLKLAQNSSTNSLFDSVTINKDIAKVGPDANKHNPEFKINVLGAAIKNEKEFGTTITNGSTTTYTDKTQFVENKLTYSSDKDPNSIDYIIMDELVKLLTKASDSTCTDYTDFTGITLTTP